MSFGEQVLIFLSVTIGFSVGLGVYAIDLYLRFNLRLRRLGAGEPEARLKIALFALLLPPVGLFLFAWVGFESPKMHWAIPTLGIVVFVGSTTVLIQTVFVYIMVIYPQYSASLLAANDFVRSAFGAGAIHIAHPLLQNVGVGLGVSILGALVAIGTFGTFALYYYGKTLRAHSNFAIS